MAGHRKTFGSLSRRYGLIRLPYALEQYISVSSNPSLGFIATKAGTTAGSLPEAYATAIAGDTVTDGTAQFFAVAADLSNAPSFFNPTWKSYARKWAGLRIMGMNAVNSTGLDLSHVRRINTTTNVIDWPGTERTATRAER